MADEIVREIQLEGRGQNVQFDIEPDVQAQGDARLVRLILVNLLENAVKFSPKGGCIRFGRTELNGVPAYFVSDQGIGFDMQYVAHLYLPFERLVRDDEFPGTGIGLANVKRIVERHHGEVAAQSELGKGSTFTFTLCPT